MTKSNIFIFHSSLRFHLNYYLQQMSCARSFSVLCAFDHMENGASHIHNKYKMPNQGKLIHIFHSLVTHLFIQRDQVCACAYE